MLFAYLYPTDIQEEALQARFHLEHVRFKDSVFVAFVTLAVSHLNPGRCSDTSTNRVSD